MVDLFGEDLATARTSAKPEAAALLEVLTTLRAHSMVSWVQRMNSGAVRIGGRFVRFGWTGCPDVLGQLKDGRLLAVEVKAEKGRLRPEQTAFLQRIHAAGGVAIMARDCQDVFNNLDRAGLKHE